MMAVNLPPRLILAGVLSWTITGALIWWLIWG
jgi:hypothetical protein